MNYPNQQTLVCSCRKCASVHPLIKLGIYNESGDIILLCPSCGFETKAKFGKRIDKFIRFLDRLEEACKAAGKEGFAFQGWEISNSTMAAIGAPSAYDINSVSFHHSCGKAFNLSSKQFEAAADTPAKFKCRHCHTGIQLTVARELMVCFRHVKRGFEDIQHGFMPDLFSCVGQSFVPNDYVFPIYQGSSQ